jgi:hypothetical protein
MVADMTSRARLVLLAVAALAAVSGLLAVDGIVSDHGSSARSAVVVVTDGPDALVATPVRSQPLPVALRGLPLAVAAAVAAASVLRSGGRLRMRRLDLRLNDAGDNWRALLLGAPPVLL